MQDQHALLSSRPGLEALAPPPQQQQTPVASADVFLVAPVPYLDPAGDVAARGAGPGDDGAPGVAAAGAGPGVAAAGAVPGLDPDAAEEVEQREGVYDMNREEIQQEINDSKKVVSSVVRGFFYDPMHIQGQFQWLTGVSSLLEKIHLNIGREVRRAERYLVSRDKKMKQEFKMFTTQR